MSESSFIEIDAVFCVAETEKAVLVRLTDDEEYWVPKSVIGEDSEVQGHNDRGVLVVADWFVKRKGML